MIPFKKILCPIDFSQHSLRALNVAAELTEHFKAEMLVIHVVTPVPLPYIPPPPMSPVAAPPTTLNIDEYQEELKSNSMSKLKEVIRNRIHKKIPITPKVILGHTSYEIVETAKDSNADLIVISTHGHSGWKRFLFGSVAEKVVRMSSVPVLTIHPPEGEGPESEEDHTGDPSEES